MNRIPSKDEIRAWIADNPGSVAKRDIARAFGIRGADRIVLKQILKELEAEGAVDRRRGHFRDPVKLPPVGVFAVLPPDRQGDQFLKPLEWSGDTPEPRVLLVARRTDAALAAGDRILARVNEVAGEAHQYEARLIRKIGVNPVRIVGIFRKGAEGGRIVPIDKGAEREWRVAPDATHGARDGELVEAEQAGPRDRLGLPRARIVERLGDPSAPKAVSLIAIHQHGIPDAFSDAAIAEADAARPVGLGRREDLRGLPFVTIDPADARDHDDACHAHPDADPANPGGHVLWVAIADVAHYVRPQSALDREARNRGNSTYFPDRVVPMLPEHLSGDLCSLHEGLERPVIAVRIVLDRNGAKLSHRFTRGMIRSVASLSYEEVQAARDGRPDARMADLLEPVILPLYAAFQALDRARVARQPLDLDLPERRIVLGEDGRVLSVAFRERLEAHRMIEEFMVAANVAAAEELVRLKRPLLFRVHEEPTPLKLDALREVAEASGFTLARGQVLKTAHLNRLLAQAEGTDFDELLNITTLRSLPQAYYNPENFGHFGLALRTYAHFTSPIRRYSDLIVHRALITAHGWGDDGLSKADIEMLAETAEKVSEAERRSMAAERDTTDRYLAAWLSDRVGAEFTGRISGVTRFGLFVKLDGSGADGLIPIRSIGREFFHFDPRSQTLMGADSGTVLGIGQKVTVRLAEAVPVTGGLVLELLSVDGAGLPGGAAPAAHGGARRAPGKARARQAKARRLAERRRR
ncbi:MAG: ribonuclease R [Rhodobacteraceae bacterium]|nr:ribonuclease R [Paracoccaceae bacterium]